MNFVIAAKSGTEATVIEPKEIRERTQTDRINSHLLKSFLSRLNTDPQFQKIVTVEQQATTDSKKDDQQFE